jgi:hypothetical protein
MVRKDTAHALGRSDIDVSTAVMEPTEAGETSWIMGCLYNFIVCKL